MLRSALGARSLTVAIAALNEERNIESTIRTVLDASAKVPDLSVEILVVDDGSTDRTSEIASTLAQHFRNVRLLRNPRNVGLGASMRRAIEEAQGERVLFVPGDNDMPGSTLELLFRNAYLADVVMCYFLNDEYRGRIRFLLSNTFMLIYTTVFDLYVQYINGPAVYPIAGLRQLELHSTRFSIVAEINVKLLRQGMSFSEIPSYRQTGLQGSTSLSFGSLLESVRVFIQLIADVYLLHRARYGKRPVRVPYDVSVRPAGSSA